LFQVLDRSCEVATSLEDFCIPAVSATQSRCRSDIGTEGLERLCKLAVSSGVIAASLFDPS
jgi:hypothetical protein